MDVQPKKIIIDVDTGVDDAQAIMLALAHVDKVDVIAITCVQGNVNINNVCRNTIRVLTVCNRLNIPVFRGCSAHIIGKDIYDSRYHGQDGMGDISNPVEANLGLIKEEHAATAIVRIVNENPGKITLVCVAPLTNICVALRLDPELGKKLKEVFIMGGNIHGTGSGPSPCAEFNFSCDPEAAYVCLRELRCPITIIPWETCIDYGQSWEWFDKWVSSETLKGKFMYAITRGVANHQRNVTKYDSYHSCDMMAIAVVLDKRIATESTETYAEVETSGRLTRGQMVCDWRGKLNQEKNVTVVKAFDVEKAINLCSTILTDIQE